MISPIGVDFQPEGSKEFGTRTEDFFTPRAPPISGDFKKLFFASNVQTIVY